MLPYFMTCLSFIVQSLGVPSLEDISECVVCLCSSSIDFGSVMVGVRRHGQWLNGYP